MNDLPVARPHIFARLAQRMLGSAGGKHNIFTVMIAVLHESFLPIGNEYKSISDYNKYLKMQILFYKYQIVFKSN
jgi:hypothetical protein